MRPSKEALASEEPFCVDTLDFAQWLQFVFIARMRMLVEHQLSLPEKCGIAPMAEEVFKVMPGDFAALIGKLLAIDDVLSGTQA